MTNIDDSTQTPPGYWFGVIEGRLHQQMRDALADLGLRRGSCRILHTLADGPATAEQLAERLPHADRRGHGDHGHGRRDGYARGRGYGVHPGWRSQEPRDERPQHEHEHPLDHDGFERAFERGYARGFDRGALYGMTRAGHPAGPFPGHGYGPFPGGHGYGPWGAGPWGAGRPAHPYSDHRHAGHGDRGHGPRGVRRAHRIHRILADFVERGWVWFDGDAATLTDEGRAAHDRAFERVREVRARLAAGIPEEDYAIALRTLETMARNLGWRPAGESTPGEDGSGKNDPGEDGPGEDGSPSGAAPRMDA